jgi:anti-sigma-K factor RskA
MTCEDLREEYELYALGLADEPERSELGEHLHRGCKTCTAGMQTARGTMALMGAAADAVVPTAKLRRRIMASVGAEPRRWGWFAPMWVAVSALCLVTAFYFYGRDRDNALQLARSRAAARAQMIELARLNEALALLNQPETRQVTFGEGTPQPPRGRVFVNPKIGVLLVASNLPAPPPGKTYEMWVIPKAGNPAPAGLFQSDAAGAALHLQKAPIDMAAIKAVAVTLEPAGGVPQPTSQPVIVAVL